MQMKLFDSYPIPIIIISLILFTSCSKVEKQYWENGNIKSELPYKNGKLQGTARWYYEDGTIQQEVPYVNNSIEGLSIRYHDNGRKELEEEYKNNIRNGRATEYSYSGRRIEIKEYVNDTLNGPYRKWHGNRELQISGMFTNGLFSGTWLYYNDYGNLVGEGRYEAGMGIQRFWNPDGSLLSRVAYVNNLKQGKEYFYKPDGSVDYVVGYDAGELVERP